MFIVIITVGSTTKEVYIFKQFFNDLTIFVNHFQASAAVDSHCESCLLMHKCICNAKYTGLVFLPVSDCFPCVTILVEMLNGGRVLWM